ncbi:hypothetical protein B0A50_02913 [Salinomyces thailandicus]|uniref:Uncharacterized protein n=1 Tax=Salinomyces thailandicus TaxID=706561 RepID=A0A4U0U2H3_9PEZI|nr:hypothetical protein B0A50_02913 [Salinomyces thailandica]
MGNCCGTQKDSTFQGEGRTLGAAPANLPPRQNNPRATAPPPKIAAAQGQKQTGGGGGGGGRTLSSAPPAAESGRGRSSEDPKAAAARAAEERAKASQGPGRGKLARQLDQQKGQSQTGILAQNARENVAVREADASAQTRNWN